MILRKLIIENFYLKDAKANVSAEILQGKAMSVPIADLHLTDIGKKTNGATAGEARALRSSVDDAMMFSTTRSCAAIGAVMIQGLNHFTVLTDDLERTLDFYVGTLGLKPGPRPDFGFPGVWLYVGGAALVGAALLDYRWWAKAWPWALSSMIVGKPCTLNCLARASFLALCSGASFLPRTSTQASPLSAALIV